MPDRFIVEPDVVLIGAGIMSATLGVFLKELEPSLSIQMFEMLGGAACESSEAWNNAGTGHAANCEMNYTPARADGRIDISKALQVNVEFDLSRQLWSYLVRKGAIQDPQSFIHSVPHMSFVRGAENVSFLKKRFDAMVAHHCYRGMEYSDDKRQIADWAPLVMEDRGADELVAATRIITGSDVDYGALTNHLVDHLSASPGFSVHYQHRVTDLSRQSDRRWRIDTHDVGVVPVLQGIECVHEAIATPATVAVAILHMFQNAKGRIRHEWQRSGWSTRYYTAVNGTHLWRAAPHNVSGLRI